MSTLTWVAIAAALFIFREVAIARKTLSRIEAKLGQPAERPDAAVHDTLHPVFSPRRLRLTRQRCEHWYLEKIRLETQLRTNEAWQNLPKAGDLPDDMRKQMAEACEAAVEAECAWKEYVFMTRGNLAVFNRSESARRVVEEFRGLLKETRAAFWRGTALLPGGDVMEKGNIQRVRALFKSWEARAAGREGGEVPADVLFQDAWEEDFMEAEV